MSIICVSKHKEYIQGPNCLLIVKELLWFLDRNWLGNRVGLLTGQGLASQLKQSIATQLTLRNLSHTQTCSGQGARDEDGSPRCDQSCGASQLGG